MSPYGPLIEAFAATEYIVFSASTEANVSSMKTTQVKDHQPYSLSQPPIKLPRRLRTLNAAGNSLKKIGLFNIKGEADHYIDWSKRKLGLYDLGDYDLASALERLLYTLKFETDLSLFGRIATDKMIRRNLMNNLLLEETFRRQPEIAEVNVEEPIIIICTPRTGSTLLHNLMAQHSRVRSPKMWELHRPCPPPTPESEFNDQRIAASDREFGLYYRMVPEMRAIHYFAPEAIEECTHLFNNIFTCRLSFSTLANSNSYTDWVMNLNMEDAYRAYKRYLQVLKFHYQDKQLVLKSPAHILSLDALVKVFPKAKLIHLHRDPATAAGSFCSLTEAVQISMRNNVDTLAIGEMWKTFWTPAMLNSIPWRKEQATNILDINFKSLVAKPKNTIESIYDHFDQDIPNDLFRKIGGYLQNHPKDEYGIHEYSLERYGLNREKLHEDYAEYINHFQVSLENSH